MSAGKPTWSNLHRSQGVCAVGPKGGGMLKVPWVVVVVVVVGVVVVVVVVVDQYHFRYFSIKKLSSPSSGVRIQRLGCGESRGSRHPGILGWSRGEAANKRNVPITGKEMKITLGFLYDICLSLIFSMICFSCFKFLSFVELCVCVCVGG